MVGSSPSCGISIPISPKTPKKSLNFLQKLHLREIRGCMQTHPNTKELRLFKTLPERLKFPLHTLIQYSDFTDGHIFLGFTKDGQFVISYAMQMELVLYPLPTYTYTLYFWRFIPHKPLKKVSEIHLFRKYEIQSELLISVCQWPLDNSKILVHGFSPLGDQEHRTVQNPCYLTIAAIPPIQTCQECKASIYSFDADEEEEEWDTRQAACLTHGFVLHVQYDLVPPFPKFNPRVSLTKDGRVVINTGDSLIALSITADCNEDVRALQQLRSTAATTTTVADNHSSELTASPCRSDSDGASSVSGAPQLNLYEHGTTLRAHYGGVDSPRSFTWKSACSPTANNTSTSSSPASTDSDQSTTTTTSSSSSQVSGADFNVTIDGHYAADRSSPSSGAATPSSAPPASASSSPVIELFASPVRKIRHHKLFAAAECDLVDTTAVSGATVAEWTESATDEQSTSLADSTRPLHTYSRNAVTSAALVDDSSGHHRLETSFVNSQNLGRGGNGVGGNSGGGGGGGGGNQHGGRLATGTHNDESVKENLSPVTENLQPSPLLSRAASGGGTGGVGGKSSDGSTAAAMAAAAQLRPASPESGTLVAHSTSGCVVRVNQVFVPCIDILLMEGEDEDVGNSAYQNSLSLAVYWPSSTPLIPCPTRLLEDVKGPVLVVKQAIFDVEQYLHEMAQRLCSEAGQKYQAFNDYDIQILDVFEETSDVLALAVMLIQAAPRNKGLIKNHRNSSGVTRKQYETGFKFLWNIQTGKCQTVDTEMLREDDTKVASYSQRSWNPGRKKCTLLQQKWSHPSAFTEEVLVLTNEPVFAGVPIDIFYSPGGDAAIERAQDGGSS